MNVNVTSDDNCLRNDKCRSHKDKDNEICEYFQGRNL